MRCRVVCALGVTIDSFCCSRAFISVLLPAFGRPMMATNPALGSGGRRRVRARAGIARRGQEEPSHVPLRKPKAATRALPSAAAPSGTALTCLLCTPGHQA